MMKTLKIIHAVAGVLCKDSMVLMASRPLGKLYELYWEFPGGKLENFESIAEALVRELKEEIGVVVKVEDSSYLTTIEQQYTGFLVKLDVMLVKKWIGEPASLENQKLYWQDIKAECTLEPLLLTTKKILDILLVI